MKKGARYWLVGATYGNEGDYASEFVSGGYWMLGWNPNENSQRSIRKQFELCGRIQKNDRIAIKKLQGQGATQMTIRFIGIVRAVIKPEFSRGRFICTVDWCNKEDMNRSVRFHGDGSAINKPYTRENEPEPGWLNSIFSI